MKSTNNRTLLYGAILALPLFAIPTSGGDQAQPAPMPATGTTPNDAVPHSAPPATQPASAQTPLPPQTPTVVQPDTAPAQTPLPTPTPAVISPATAPTQSQPVPQAPAVVAPGTAPAQIQPAPQTPLVVQPATSPATTQPTAETPTVVSSGATQPGREQLGKKIVTASLERTREQIAPALGAVTYTIGQSQIENIPGGENASFQQVLLRAPGVVEDSFGQVHIRGEHANLTYRVNGVLLPQPVNVFGQEIDTRLVATSTLIDGTLPAEFGFHTAGIVDITTKSGATLNHNELTLYGGMYDTIQPSLQLGGTSGKLDYFVATSYNHNALGIENTTSSHTALHDDTDQERIFAYVSYHIDDTSRLSIFFNAYDGQFQIPDSKGLPPAFTFAGHPNPDSAQTNENQNEQEYYTAVSYQKSVDKLSYQLSAFTRYGQISFKPDYVNDLIFQGVSGAVYNSYITYGAQLDSSYILDDQHTIRLGFVADYTTEKENTSSGVFPTDATGAQTSDIPFVVSDHSGEEATEAGIYIQDEFKVTRQLTFNYGARYDRFDASFDREGQLSPRANFVYKIDDATTAHVGYARYFVPPPVQNVRPGTLAKFVNTSNAPTNPGDNAPRVERSNYYDIGLSRQISKPFQVNIDGFYKEAHQLVDLGQFGSAVIESPFNYQKGTVAGAELSGIYKQGGFNAFANFSWVKTLAHGIDTQQFFFDPSEFAYIAQHNIKLDHESEYTISAGASYTWKDNRVYVDMLYGSGLRAGFANTMQEQQYYPVNVGYEHIFHGGFWGSNNVKFRADIVNIFDQSYQLRQGGGLGVNADQFGQRRAVFAGLTYEF